jgi:HIP---CoA ligase
MSALTIPGVLDQAAERWANRPAIEDGDTVLSFSELREAALDCTAALLAAGIERGDRVAIWAPNVWEWVVVGLGIHGAGAVLVPINTRYKGDEAADVLERSGARLLFTVEGFLGNAYVRMLDRARPDGIGSLEHRIVLRGTTPPACSSWATFLSGAVRSSREAAEARAASVSPDDLSDLLYTSGTTGRSKGVMTTHGQNTRAFRSWSEVVGLADQDRYLIVNPFFHAFGYKAGWLSALLTGATILPHAVFDPDAVFARIACDRVSMLPGPPALYQRLLAHPGLASADLSSLRLAVTGAASIPVTLIEQMRDTLGFDTVITGYGLTEACGIATMCRFDDDPTTIATTSGRAIDGVEVQVVDDAGAEVSRGTPGEVVVRGYNVMRGYLDDPENTARAIQGGWLHTGDIGVMDEAGYLRITDRKGDMFIVGGFNCYPAEIENVMVAHPALVQAAVVGVPDRALGQVPKAFVVLVEGAALDQEALIVWCRDRMANFKVPRAIEFCQALPMNATGKVQRFRLRDA